MRIFTIFVIYLFALLVCFPLRSVAFSDIKFKRISVDQGLSQSTIYAIVQDKGSNMWFATSDGLNRFDGYNFTVFRNIKGDSTSLAGNLIHSLYVDVDGELWVGGNNFLSHYDKRNNRFENYTLPDFYFQLLGISDCEDPRQLVLATNNGIMTFDKGTKRLAIKGFLEGVMVNNLFRNGASTLLGTTKGLYAYSAVNGTLKRVAPQLENCEVTSIVRQANGESWVATNGQGLFHIDESLRNIKHYTRIEGNDNSLRSNYLRAVQFDTQGRLWIGTYEGLHILEPRSGEMRCYLHDYNDLTSLNHNSIRTITPDNQGGMWLGSFYGGVHYYHPLSFRFNNLQHNNSANSLKDNTVSCIVEEKSTGNLWIGTNASGLSYYRTKTGTFTQYHLLQPSSAVAQSNDVKCILPDGDNMWIGTHLGGLSQMNTRSGKITTYAIKTDIPLNNGCYALLDGNDGTIWAGTLSGIHLFDKATHTFSLHPMTRQFPEFAKMSINVLFRDSHRRVWIGAKEGLFLYLPDKNRIERFSNIRCEDFDVVMCVTEDSRGQIWIGSFLGLYLYDEKSRSMTNYSVTDGLPNNIICGILEDAQHRLWLSTSKGLCCFTPWDKSFRNYTVNDGIASNQFNPYSYCKSSDGVLYFGGIKGITYFNPLQLADNPFTPKVKITDFTVFNREVEQGDDVHIDRDDEGNITHVSISSSHNFFDIRYVVTNLLSQHRNRYAYKLDGLNEEWYYTDNCSVNFTNLSPGLYRFMVKAANSDGKWCNESTLLTLRVRAIWYQTIMAKIIFVLMALSLIFVLVRYFLLRNRMKMQLYMEKMEKESIEQISQETIKFYINSSHELRTPLTLIISPLQEIRNHGTLDHFVKTRLDYVYNNSVRLLRMVNQLLDFRKTELGMRTLQVTMIDIEKVVGGVFAMFERSAQKRDMNYMLCSEVAGECFLADKIFIEQITTNLISNAFRYTPDGGTIKVTLRSEPAELIICVADNGKGIPADKIGRIFDRFYQIQESYSGTGIGLSIVKNLVELHHGKISVSSRPNESTEFIVSIPVGADAYAQSEMVTKVSAVSPALTSVETLDYDCDYYADESDSMPADDERETLLIVEDDSQIRQYLVLHFRQKFNVHTACDGEQALVLLKSVEPDLILSDVMMPGMDGIRLCQIIKQNLKTSHIPIILLTAKDTTDDYRKGVDAGADDYIVKPFDMSILDGKVSNLLRLKYRLRQHYTNSTDVDPDRITSNSIDGDFLKKAIAIVEKNLDNIEFSANDFSREICMSRSNLHLKLKSITGESTTQFIRKIRFNHACRLLSEGKYAISEISTMVGFNTHSYFTSSFKKYVGCMPTEYPKSGHKNIDE